MMNHRAPARDTHVPDDMPHLEGVRHHFLALPGLRMHVAEAGSGEPLLLLHGALQHWWAWHEVLPALAQRYRVLVPDLRGFGWTDAPRCGYSRAQSTADLLAALDALGCGATRLVSTDMGALPAFGLCYDVPERVQAHVVIGVPPLPIKVGLRHLKAFLPLWHQEVGAIPILAPALLGRGRQPLARHMLLNFSPPGKPADPGEVERYLARLRLPGRARAASASIRELVLPELVRISAGRYRRMRLTTPTLVLAGTEDRSFPPSMLADLARTAEPWVDRMEVGTISGAAHYVAQEQPELLADAVLRFLGAETAPR
ncbi:MAG TPA: alpha/beta hydrolase [Naasia sp.]|jgi:pimeloyl-ACP methyl ester carboxylesterase